jgi:hypothetical protein
MNEQPPEFDGEEVQFGRTTRLVVPPLALGAVKKYAKRIAEFHKLPVEEQMQLTSEIALAALKRNYPDVTIGAPRRPGGPAATCRRVFQARGAGGRLHRRRPPGENAEGTTSQSTGQPSTPSSRPALGWTYPATSTSHVTLHDLAALNAYWSSAPPVHVSVARYLGYKPKASRQNSENLAAEAAAEFGPPRTFVPRVPIQGATDDRSAVHDHGGR